jgi:hypothetical protein
VWTYLLCTSHLDIQVEIDNSLLQSLVVFINMHIKLSWLCDGVIVSVEHWQGILTFTRFYVEELWRSKLVVFGREIFQVADPMTRVISRLL